MTRYNLFLFILIVGLHACAEATTKNETEEASGPKGPFFGIVPTEEPQLLSPEFLASPVTEYNGTFSPDGKMFFYTTDAPWNAYITYTRMQEDSTWSVPKVAPFSGTYSDYDPLFTPDGKRLYFSSSRPQGDNENSKIWYVEQFGENWSEPIRVTLTGEEDNEYYSSLTHEGVLYFNIWSKGDIYKATPKDSIYDVEPLPEIINGGLDKGDPFISPDEDYLIYRGYDESLGRGDLYISFNIDGDWTSPENLGPTINSKHHEMCPWVSQDGKLFIFASGRLKNHMAVKASDSIGIVHDKFQSYDNGQLNLYYMSTNFIEELRKKHL